MRAWPTLLGLALLLAAIPAAAQAPERVPRPRLVAPAGPVAALGEAWRERGGRRTRAQWESELYELARGEGWAWAEVAAGDGRIHLRPGPRATLARVSFPGADSLAVRTFLRGSGIAEGQPWRPRRWEQRLADGVAALGEAGHPFARVSLTRLEADPATGELRPTLLLDPGPQAVFGELRVVGAHRTRADRLAQMAQVERGRPFSLSALAAARQRLLARDIVSSVRQLRPVRGDGPGVVDLLLEVEQPARAGSLEGALGLSGEAGERQRLSGRVQLELLDIFGTARQFRGRFLDDGAQRRQLELGYLEPLLLGTSLDLRVQLHQRHEDDRYDTVGGEFGVRLPWGGGLRRLELGAGLDRTTFVGEAGRVRLRRRALLVASSLGRRGPGAGLWGGLGSRVEAALVAERGDSNRAEESQQLLVDTELRAGLATGDRLALESVLHWQSIEGGDEELPRSELLPIGGATSVRGYREEAFLGRRLAWGQLSLVAGPDGGGQAYLFHDRGWVLGGDGDERWLAGYGVGLRSPTAAGALDLSLGFAGRLEFSSGKLHLSLRQAF